MFQVWFRLQASSGETEPEPASVKNHHHQKKPKAILSPWKPALRIDEDDLIDLCCDRIKPPQMTVVPPPAAREEPRLLTLSSASPTRRDTPEHARSSLQFHMIHELHTEIFKPSYFRVCDVEGFQVKKLLLVLFVFPFFTF